jgi:hypothetical protein
VQQRARQFWWDFFDNRATVAPCLKSKVRAVSQHGFNAATLVAMGGCQGADNTTGAGEPGATKQVRLKLIKTTLVTIQSSTAKLSGNQPGVMLA